jgi:DNA polymerase-3 subunit alpha
MWVKTHYPEVFFAATLTILNDDKLDGIVRDARLHKCEVCPPDINMSTQRFEIVKTSDGHKLITPFHRVKGLTEKTAAQIISTRKKIGGRFNEIADLEHIKGQRQFTKKQQEALDAVGAFAQIDPGSKAANDPERRKAQLELMPGLIIDHVFTSRAPVSGADIKDILVRDVIKPVRACKGCSLAGGVHPIPRLGKSPEIMIVTDAPNYSEEKANAMYSGKASGFLKEAIDSSGLDSSRAYFTSLVKSPKSEKVLTPEQINGCVGYLKKELEIIKPSVIVTLGAESTKFFMPGLKGGWAENTNKVFYSSEYDANVVIGFNPSMIAFAVERQVQLNEVFQTVSELLV